MSLPWVAQAAHHKAAIREGLTIVRKVIARDAAKTGLSTKQIFKLALREPPPPSFSLAITSETADWPVITQPGRDGRKRIPGPAPPHPRHPVRSLSFLKHHILPIIEGERSVRHVREKRVGSQAAASARASKQRSTSGASLDAVWLWRATKTSERAAPSPAPSPPLRTVYDCSHMKPSKRKAHKAREAFVAKRTMLRARSKALQAETRRKAEAPLLAARRIEARARHEAAEKAAVLAKAERRKRWEEQNPVLARTLAKKQVEAAQTSAAPKPAAPSKRLRAT